MLSTAALAASLALGGCVWFASLTGDSQAAAQAEAQRQAEEAARQQELADQQLAAELDTARAAALAEGATYEQVLAFADRVAEALQGGAIERGRISPAVVEEVWAALDQQYAALGGEDDGEDPSVIQDRGAIELTRGDLLVLQGRQDEAAAHYLAAVELEPGVERFELLAALTKTATTDAAVLRACPLVRPAIDATGLPDFVAVCLDAARGDRAQLAWSGAEADLRAFDEEMARRAEAERLRAEEEARLAAEQAQLAAEQAAQAQRWANAAVFAAGRCRFSNCLTDGWERSTDEGTVTTTCRFSNCLEDGWETRFPDGSRATTTCRFSDCMKDGWETRFPDGSTATTSCRFSNCAEDGWETRLPDGSTATTSCRFSKCFEDGWETRMPGGTVTCTCRFSNCLEDGTECR